MGFLRSCVLARVLAGGREEPKELRAAARSNCQVIDLAVVGQPERPPAPAEVLAEPLGRRPTGGVGVEQTPDGVDACEKAEPVDRQMSAAWAAGGQVPADRRQVAE